MRWGNPNALYLLLIIPFIIILLILSGYIRKKRFKRFAEDKFYDYFFDQFSAFHWQIKNIILLIPLFLIIIASARPQWGQDVQIVYKEGLDIVICIDVSLSMMATDVKPSRLARAKDQISYFLNKLSGDRVALVPFAGTSFVKLPMTSDYQAARLFLDLIDTGSVPKGGTNIGDALLSAANAFPDPERNKVIVLISDGEDLDQQGVNIASKISEKGIRIYTLGIGSTEGSPIKIARSDDDFEYLTYQDEIIISKLDVDTLNQIAQKGNGQFFLVTPHQAEIYEILRAIEELEKDKYEAKEYVRYKEQYLYFAIPALVLIIIESLILFGKKKKRFLV